MLNIKVAPDLGPGHLHLSYIDIVRKSTKRIFRPVQKSNAYKQTTRKSLKRARAGAKILSKRVKKFSYTERLVAANLIYCAFMFLSFNLRLIFHLFLSFSLTSLSLASFTQSYSIQCAWICNEVTIVSSDLTLDHHSHSSLSWGSWVACVTVWKKKREK